MGATRAPIPEPGTMRLSLKRVLLGSMAAALLASLVPAGFALDRRLSAALEANVRTELARAPVLLEDRNRTRADALMMHAQEAAATVGLAGALADGDRSAAAQLLSSTRAGEEPIVVDPGGSVWLGPEAAAALLPRTQQGESPVAFVRGGDTIYVVSIAPVEADGRWRGAAGVAQPVNEEMLATLAGLTASDVIVVGMRNDVLATTASEPLTRAAAAQTARWAPGAVREDTADAVGRYWAIAAPLGDAARVVFVQDAQRELALLPQLRRDALLAGAIVLAASLLLIALIASMLARPVVSLARAADRLAAGDFHAPLDASRIREVDRMARAFNEMRDALHARLEELAAANRKLEERQARLRALQAELIHRDRLAADARLLSELAHEIRNPVANVRNCLEVIHRRVGADPKARQFVDLAIDELLRMHELAEQMLDLNRPLDPDATRCDVGAVVAQVASLLSIRNEADRWPIDVTAGAGVEAAMGPDTLKQVLVNVLRNAREAMPEGGRTHVEVRSDERGVSIEVADEGPGIPEDVLPRIFDPFFTTKGSARGIGLGLFVAEGLARRYGGRLRAHNRPDGGACFTIELPSAGADLAPATAAAPAGEVRGLEEST